jgi:nucleotidyltransferase AbiEii toxin of type IV toxin-antitoxin system
MNCMLHLSTVDSDLYKLLQKIFKTAIIRNNFALAGGTSLALQIGHRKSIDLDIFSPSEYIEGFPPFTKNWKEIKEIITTAFS